jgi:hypothetical protein
MQNQNATEMAKSREGELFLVLLVTLTAVKICGDFVGDLGHVNVQFDSY